MISIDQRFNSRFVSIQESRHQLQVIGRRAHGSGAPRRLIVSREL
jgi:hypothetical protein